MSITAQLGLPKGLAGVARAKGLLEPRELARMIAREVSAEVDAGGFFEMVRQLRSLPGEPMTMEETRRKWMPFAPNVPRHVKGVADTNVLVSGLIMTPRHFLDCIGQ